MLRQIEVKKVMTSQQIHNLMTGTSSSVEFHRATGFSTAFVDVSGVVSVTLQCSLDNVTYYDAVDSDGNALGKVYTSLSSAKYISFSPVLSPYVRLQVTSEAESVVSITFLMQV